MNTSDDNIANKARTLLKITGLLAFIVGVIFNIFIVSLFDPEPPLTSITKSGIIRSEVKIFILSLILIFISWLIKKNRSLTSFFNREIVVNLFLILMSVVYPLLLLELIARPFTVDHLTKKKTSIFIEDKDLGWRLRPNSRQNWGYVDVDINKKGVIGPEIPYKRDGSSMRILYIGDSVTFGFGLKDYNFTYPYAVGRILEKEYQRKMETINAGVDGYSTWQYLEYLRKEGIKYKPDIVIVGFVLNDVTEMFRLERFGGKGIGNQLNQSYYSVSDWMKHNIGIYALLLDIKTRIFLGPNPKEGAITIERANVSDLALYPDSAKVQKAWKITKTYLEQIVEYCRQRDIPLCFVIFPYTFQFRDIAGLSTPQKVLINFLEGKKVPCLDLLPLLYFYMIDHRLHIEDLFLDYDHLNPKGNEVVARMIADFINKTPQFRAFFKKP